MTYRDHYHPTDRGDMGNYDEWKTTDRRDEEQCSICGGEGVIIEILPAGASWVEVVHTCPVCGTEDEHADLDPDDQPMPTDDRSGVREPD
jgi:hypothetical protein